MEKGQEKKINNSGYNPDGQIFIDDKTSTMDNQEMSS